MASATVSHLAIVALLAAGLASCGGLDVETVQDDCAGSSCDFPGIEVAAEMVASGDTVGGAWNEWLEPVRDAIRAAGADGWSACSGDTTTVTYTAEQDADGYISLEPLRLAVARWEDGQVQCVGWLDVPGVTIPLPANQLPGPGDTLQLTMPQIGASFELDG